MRIRYIFNAMAVALLAGCVTTDTATTVKESEPIKADARKINQIATVSDLDNLFGKQVMVLTVPMNDQSYQPFSGTGMQYNRARFPMWTDANFTINIKNGDTNVVINLSTVRDPSDILAATNTSYFSVEIPAVYRGSPDYRWNRRIDYTKYTSIGEFLMLNSENRIFESLEQGRRYWQSSDMNPTEEITYAPRFFLVKINLKAVDPKNKWANSRNPNIQVSFNRSIGDKRYETVDGSDELIWTPIMPKWVYKMVANDFADGDLE